MPSEQRGILAKENLPGFKIFMSDHGWVEQPLTNMYEVYRAKHKSWPYPVIVYKNSKNEELTTANAAYNWALMYRAFNRAKQNRDRQARFALQCRGVVK